MVLNLWRQYRHWKKFERLPHRSREIVFYSEGPWDWPHLGPIVEHLLQDPNLHLCFLSSQGNEPLKGRNDPRVHFFEIGNGAIRTLLFKSLQAKIFITSLPDLESFFLKRSVYPVHYIYVFHSVCSTHMVYRADAFDAFDTLLCVGPYQIEEVRAREKLKALPGKNLEHGGHPRLDSLLKAAAKFPSSPEQDHFLIAPSWGPGSFIETAEGFSHLKKIIEDGLRISLRLHPMTVRRKPDLIKSLESLENNHRTFTFIKDLNEQASFFRAEVCVSDWSGAALEFSLVTGRPSLFIDSPRKVLNPNYEELNLEPLEVTARQELGQVIALQDLQQLKKIARNLRSETKKWTDQIAAFRNKNLYHWESSAAASAEVILALKNKK